MHWDGWMTGWGVLMMVLMALFWIVLIAGLVWLVVWLVRKSGAPETIGHESALDILNKRYARGELGEDEYERMKRRLSE